MPGPAAEEILFALSDALPPDAERRTELVALGMLASLLIGEVAQEERGELTETFCKILRGAISESLN